MINRRPPLPGDRLGAAIALAGDCHRFADIGADHGRLSLALLREGNREGLVTDLSDKALSKARLLLSRFPLSGKASFAVSDGLDALGDFAPDTVFILGMGGDTISGILNRGKDALNSAALILSGQTELPLLRRTVYEIGYHITEETAVRENGRDYLLLRAEPAPEDQGTPDERTLFLGPVLLQEHPAAWLSFLQRQERYYSEAIQALSSSDRLNPRLESFCRERDWIRSALDLYQEEEEEK